MSAIPSMFEASLGPSTELARELELVRSPGHCGTLEPRWWVVDIGVRARVLDTSAGSVLRPGAAEFKKREFGTRAPLHVRLEVGLLDRASGSSRDWLVDATSLRAYVLASTITVYLVGPESLVQYREGEGRSLSAARDVFCQVQAGIWPCDTVHQRVGVPGPSVRGSNCTMRVHVPTRDVGTAVPIPAGARSLAIFDSSGSNEPWTWQLGEPAVERYGRIAIASGQTVDTALVPNFTHVAPVATHNRERNVLLVFGVDL
jgi:hypothetical protein